MPKIPPPKGTRDLYPLEAARRRWLSERWRRVSIRHGFEEVDGPTFENSELYAVKSGEGILNELFQAFSGKDPKDIERIRAGDPAPFAMRPEFTPTLARMYAERARTLPSPCKWFQIGPCFRAERPQRGRLREFLQWNLDWVGDNSTRADAELIACCIEFLENCGLRPDTCRVRLNDRTALQELLVELGISDESLPSAFSLLDKRDKIPPEVFLAEGQVLGLSEEFLYLFGRLKREFGPGESPLKFIEKLTPLKHKIGSSWGASVPSWSACIDLGISTEWLITDPYVVRGLAYYTGTVFEVIADGERAIAGGGRYDNLIELFGGPPTPAVGFAMGDVVISLLLQDKGLMPSDAELMEEIGARPDVFVIAPQQDLDPIATRLLATLRREGLHARRSYKSTRKVPKLLSEASRPPFAARLAIILDSPTQATIKNLDSTTQQTVELPADDPFAPLLALIHDMLATTGT